ncbi:alpha-L-rhamnosidase C-terminal domain-containing protein [Streptomyces sp. NPDC059787]|uniref:alpha-L-rhamnosidase C-terminal domain-containing protein n=1 Tax=Streptomyces sp. NPDC059787 TaxID=3346947 RepID=UPI0036597CD1
MRPASTPRTPLLLATVLAAARRSAERLPNPGLQRDPHHPGCRYFFLQPHLESTRRITHVAAHHESSCSRLESERRIVGPTLSHRVMEPANTTASLRSPALDVSPVTEDRVPLAGAEGVS